MQLVRRSRRPVSTYPSIFNSFFNDDFFNDDFFKLSRPKASVWNGFKPAVNVRENEDQFDLEVAVPGFNKKDFNVQVDKNILTISAEVKDEKEEKDGENWTRKEFNYNSFKRSFTLPETVEGSKIVANYKDGILNITIPKKEEAKPQPVRTIEIA